MENIWRDMFERVEQNTGDIDARAPTDSPVFTGTPTAPTAAPGTNTTQLATTAYALAAVAAAVTGLLEFKGSTNCSSNPNYPAALKGDAYIVSVAGKIGGASGKSVDVGDVYVANTDNPGGTEASVGAAWFVLEHNLVGALLSANNLSDLASVSTARSNLGLVIGTDVEPHDADLTTIAGLSPANDDVLQRKSGAWTNRNLAQLKTDLAMDNVAVRVQNSADTTLTEDTFTTLTFDTELFDDYAMHSTSSNTSRLTAVRAGKYCVHGLVSWEASAVGVRLLRILKNANASLVVDWQQLNACAVGNTRMSLGGAVVHLDAGDYVELQAYFYFTGSGGSLKVLNQTVFSPTFSMFWVCP